MEYGRWIGILVMHDIRNNNRLHECMMIIIICTYVHLKAMDNWCYLIRRLMSVAWLEYILVYPVWYTYRRHLENGISHSVSLLRFLGALFVRKKYLFYSVPKILWTVAPASSTVKQTSTKSLEKIFWSISPSSSL